MARTNTDSEAIGYTITCTPCVLRIQAQLLEDSIIFSSFSKICIVFACVVILSYYPNTQADQSRLEMNVTCLASIRQVIKPILQWGDGQKLVVEKMDV